MNIDSFIEDIVKAEQRLSELKAYEEHRANEDITEAVLICHPKVKNVLKKAIHENNLKDIPIISTPLAEEEKIYMCTDKEFIKNARMMMGIKQTFKGEDMDRNIIGIYSMLLANLQMNYQIMSVLVGHDNPVLKEWRIYIDDLDRVLEKFEQQDSN